MPTTIEDTVDEQATDDGRIFDPAPFTRPIPKLDGHVADRLGIGFGGTVKLNRLLDDNLEYLEGLRLGQTIELTIEATVAGKGFTHTTKANDDEEVGYAVKLRVHSITGLPTEGQDVEDEDTPTEEDATA